MRVPKRLVSAVVAAVTLAATTGVASATAPLALPRPALHYEFDADDLTSGAVTDSAGNGLDGVLVNGTTAALVDGADGGVAIDLPGGGPASTGAYVRLPREVLAGGTDLTVSVRLRWDGTTAPWQWIYALGRDTGRYLFSTPYNGDGRLRSAVTTAGGGAEAQVTGYTALPANVWRTLTVTLDTTADRVTSYLDGTAVASAATTATAGELLDTAEFAGYLGKSFYQDPLFDGAVDDFLVYREALTAAQVAESVGGQVPTPVALSQDSFAVRTTTGTAPALPAGVRAAFTDGFDRQVPTAWSTVDPDDYAAPGTFTVTGSAADHPLRATVTVVREGQLIVDLAQDTGEFHGGAAGTLYGLYGQGVPTNNLIEGMNLRTVSTKAQDGPQHPGADALEVVEPLADSTDGDVYIYMTDIHRGFPYQWPGATPAEKLALYREKVATQVDQVLRLAPQYRDNIVFVPFNEPEGNMFGTGEWSYDGTSWLTDPTDYFAAWDDFYRLVRSRMPAARVAGPNTSILFDQVKDFLVHTRDAGTLPDVVTWHELSHPEQVRTSVARYRAWEAELLPGVTLPVNVNEYAFNYHTSVPGQMVQWLSAIEESKVDADMAYWNIDGNLSDSAVQANRANGQWWLFNAYGGMSGHTVRVSPPFPGENYSLQGVATVDRAKRQARAVLGGSTGRGWVQFTNVPAAVFGDRVHAWVREIPWTGQIGDSGPPRLVAEETLRVRDGQVLFDFDGGDLPRITESSAYEIVLTPQGSDRPSGVSPSTWQGSYEAEDAAHTGDGYSRNGPEGSPSDVSKFYTSGAHDVGGLRTGSNVALDFTVDVPNDGTYDLSVFANSLNTYDLVREQGPTNVFLRVDGAAEQELYLPLGYKWVVWDHTDTTVRLTRGRHVVTLAARSKDGTRGTKGDAIVDRLTLSLPNPRARTEALEAELSWLDGGRPVYDQRRASGSGAVELGRNEAATFWVYSATDAESTIHVDTLAGRADLTVNGQDAGPAGNTAVSLSGGINKVTVTGSAHRTLVDRITVTPTDAMRPATYEAEDARRAGTVEAAALSRASGGEAVRGIGGEPGNGNTLTFTVRAAKAGVHAVRVRYANPEQSEATHYNPDPLARHADISVNGGAATRVSFPHSFHENNFWEQTVYLRLDRGANTISFRSEELPNFDGVTYASDTFPGVLLRSSEAPVIDRITVVPFAE
ncbi:LamG-like jellyroll fold domain-containing protein [Actinophytocola oryzae]|uniref:Ig-like protein group 4 n=1 Tax=Actinophytocola oryzae TaxID=502181 RepID=A0A4R7W367_9PSEU|nr:LamG-like jellyroll fold domain-containing protein [Actinophytocola oryzae]TDV56605.1 Ig-like protein group 4 [Actinophytocola oryzae]